MATATQKFAEMLKNGDGNMTDADALLDIIYNGIGEAIAALEGEGTKEEKITAANAEFKCLGGHLNALAFWLNANADLKTIAAYFTDPGQKSFPAQAFENAGLGMLSPPISLAQASAARGEITGAHGAARALHNAQDQIKHFQKYSIPLISGHLPKDPSPPPEPGP